MVIEEKSEEGKKLPGSLIKIQDVLGLSEPGKRLIESIERGVGALTSPWQQKRQARTEIEIASQWMEFLKKSNLSANVAELTLQDRGMLRLMADAGRKQSNREDVAVAAFDAYRAEEIPKVSYQEPMDHDWLDRYWRLAENVSNKDFQLLWGRILARQAKGNQQFSPRCLETLSLLTPLEARTLEQLAPQIVGARNALGEMRYYLLYDIESQAARNISTAEEKQRLIRANEHIKTVLGEWHEQMFAPIGIYASSEGAWAISATAPFINRAARFSIAGDEFKLEGYPANVHAEYASGAQIKIGHGIPFSIVGSEILGLIQTSPKTEYVDALRDAFAVVGLSLSRV